MGGREGMGCEGGRAGNLDIDIISSPSPCHKNPRDFLGIFMGIDGCECKEP